MALTPKQQRFVEEYLVDLNATQAATRAGYSARTARQQGDRLLSNVDIAAAVASGRDVQSRRTGITAERVIKELASLAFSDPRKLLNPDGSFKPMQEWDAEAVAAVASIEFNSYGGISKVRMWDKNSALEKLGKHLGLYVERVQHTGPDDGAVKFIVNFVPSVRSQAPASAQA